MKLKPVKKVCQLSSTEEARMVHYEVTLPDGKVKPVALNCRATGQDCLQMLCNSLGVAGESDYFGLAYPGGHGEELWVNSRNRLAKQLQPDTRCRLRLAVRFFVQPHMLVLDETRLLFLLEARRRSSTSDSLEQRPESLEQAAQHPDYGWHYYPAEDCFRAVRCIGVGPQGVCVCKEDRSVVERYAYPRVQKVSKSGRLVYLLLSNPDGSTREVGFRLTSAKAANGLYRFVTEMHSFFRCDTVRSGVWEQKSRDIKSTLVSLIFAEPEALTDPKFLFDVRRTSREVHDCARRRQFRLCSAAVGTAGHEKTNSEPPAASSSSDAASLRLKLKSILQERICHLCADQDLSVVFVPCGHMVACESCSEKLQECPVCRQAISIRQKFCIPA